MKKIILTTVTLILILTLAACTQLGVAPMKKTDQKMEYTPEEYNQKLADFKEETLLGVRTAAEAGDLIGNVWRDTIYEEYNADTAPYTIVEGYALRFNKDFNASLNQYFSSEHYIQTMASIDVNIPRVDKLFSGLKNTPEECEDGYEVAQQIYEEYNSIVRMVKSPSGSLDTYSGEYSDAVDKYLDFCDRLDRYFTVVEFTPETQE